MASKISKETTSIQRGFGEKVGQCINAGFAFFFGFFFAFFFGAYFTLILLAGFPILACVFVGFGLALDKGQLEMLRAYAQSAGYAEQALHSIRVVHTYG